MKPDHDIQDAEWRDVGATPPEPRPKRDWLPGFVEGALNWITVVVLIAVAYYLTPWVRATIGQPLGDFVARLIGK